jgi:multidrug efflux pump subunit AcrA (membrane-fusion protein)
MKQRIIYLICVFCILLSACGILPQEEEYERAPLVPEYQREQWEVAYVQRGDMVLSHTMSCTYMPVQTQTVSFDEADARFDELFVAVGDRVVAGQLLAQLDVSGLQEQMEECELQIEKLQLKLAAMEENLALALDRERILREGSTQQELEAALEKIQMQYDLQKQPLVDEAEILQMRLEDCRTKLQNRRLYAGIDGIVTFTRSVKKGDRIAAGEKLVVIEDSASSAFCADSRYWQYFQPGQECAQQKPSAHIHRGYRWRGRLCRFPQSGAGCNDTYTSAGGRQRAGKSLLSAPLSAPEQCGWWQQILP